MIFDIENYIETNLERARPVQSGNGTEMTAVCPSCKKYGGFYVNTSTGAYLCNKCDFKAKTVIGLVACVEDITWSEARSFIFTRSVKLRRKHDFFSLGDKIRSLRLDAIREDESIIVDEEFPEHFVPIFDKDRNPNWKIPKYLKSRQITSRTARDWGLGYCTKGKYANRLIIPVVCPNGSSWTARAMSNDVVPKYLNPSGADHSRLLIGWDVAMVTGDVVLCEGPLDALKLYQNNISALGLGGKKLHDAQLSLLMTLSSGSAITVMLDPEEIFAPYEVADRLLVHFDYVYVARLPKVLRNGEMIDPGSAPKKLLYDAVENAKRWTGLAHDRLSCILRK